MEVISIKGRKIGPGHLPLVVAEMSGNHNQSLNRALKIVEAAAKSGAHAVKLQTYTADTMTLDIADGDFFIDDPKSLWHGYSLYELYQKAYTPWEWHEPIMERCQELGLICFSTPFDATAVDFLEELNVPCHKIASFENTDLPLIRKVASTGKPMIISTGMATVAELDETVRTARKAGCQDLVLLKCTSTYPATPENTNLRTIPYLRDLFDVQVGLSDHTMGIGASVASVTLGATFIEKHFTLRRADGGVDSDFSMEPEEMAQLVVESERAWQALGKVQLGPISAETASQVFRRSIYAAVDIEAGEPFTPNNLRIIRPGHGLPPKYYSLLLGKQSRYSIKKGTPINFEQVL
ncbi:MAG: pseudaminic acid synthase [Cyanobacteria bacterium P01_F01_bin.56]